MKNILTLFLSVVGLYSMGQVSLGVIAEPAYNIASIGSTPQNVADSFTSIKQNNFNISIGIEIRKQIDRYQSFSVIPTFYQTSMLHVQKDLQFLDVVHPQLIEIRDFAQAATKNAKINYRQQYAGAQFIYNKALQIRKMPNKMAIELNGGLGMYYLINGDVKVTTEGFAIQDEFIHVISDSIGIENRPYHLNLSLGSDLTYEVSPTVSVAAGIKIPIPLTSATTSLPKVTIFNPALRVSLRKTL